MDSYLDIMTRSDSDTVVTLELHASAEPLSQLV